MLLVTEKSFLMSQLNGNDRTHDQKTKLAKKIDLLWPENKTVQ
jgi:hypothetical protein